MEPSQKEPKFPNFRLGWVIQNPLWANVTRVILFDGVDALGLVDYNGVSWDYHIKDTKHGFFTPVIVFYYKIVF